MSEEIEIAIEEELSLDDINDYADINGEGEDKTDDSEEVKVVKIAKQKKSNKAHSKARNNDHIKLCYSSCQLVSVMISVLTKMGIDATIAFSQDSISCSHSNTDSSVMFDVNIRTEDVISYSYKSKYKTLLLGIRPSQVLSNLGKKKAQKIEFEYTNKTVTCKLAGSDRGFPIHTTDSAIDQLDLPDYGEPNVKMTLSELKERLVWITKGCNVLIRPFTSGFQIFSINNGRNIMGDAQYGDIDEPMFPIDSETKEHEFIHGQTRFLSSECVAIKNLTIQTILEALKSGNDHSVVKIYFSTDRMDYIKISGISSNGDGIWSIYFCHVRSVLGE